jgi:hypothetical protein
VAEKAYCLSLKAFLINRLLRRPNALRVSYAPIQAQFIQSTR